MVFVAAEGICDSQTCLFESFELYVKFYVECFVPKGEKYLIAITPLKLLSICYDSGRFLPGVPSSISLAQ